MKAPIPTAKAFPKSWKKRRALEVGETIRFSDRVLFYRQNELLSFQLGKYCGGKVNATDGPGYPVGWYYRKINAKPTKKLNTPSVFLSKRVWKNKPAMRFAFLGNYHFTDAEIDAAPKVTKKIK